MKQRLLFALLMLFTSMGFVKAADEIVVTSNGTKALKITLNEAATIGASNNNVTFSADNKTVTISQGYTAEVTLSTEATTMTFDGNMTALAVTSNNLTALNFGATNYLNSLTVKSTSLQTLKCSGLGMETLALLNATALTTLDASDNKLIHSKLEITANITSLNLSKNNFSEINLSAFSGLKTLDMSNNVLTSSGIKLPTSTSFTSLNLSDNKILGAVTNAPTGTVYGTQTLATKSAGGAFTAVTANTGFRINTLISEAGISALPTITYSNVSWQVKSSDVYREDLGETAHLQPNWPGEYRFYDNTSKEFVSGTYQCTLTCEGRTYRISELTVNPAEFTLKWTKPTNSSEMSASVNGAAAVNSSLGTATVKQGDNVLFSVTPETGYEQVTYSIEGMVPANTAQQAPYIGKTFECIVKGLYKSDGTSVEPKVTAVVSGKPHRVTFETTQQVGGTFTVQKQSGSVISALQPGETIATGDKLIVAIKPNTGYGFSLTENNVDKTGSVKEDVSNGNYTYTVDITDGTYQNVTSIAIAVTFTNTSVDATVKVDGKFLNETATTPAYVVNQTVTIQVGATKHEINSATAVQLAPKTNYQATFTLGTVAGSSTIKNGVYRLKDLTINGGELVSLNSDLDLSNNDMKYTVVFTTNTSAVCLSITTKTMQTASIEPVYDSGSGGPQTQIYDGKSKPILFATNPANLNESVTVTYKKSGTDLGETAPVNVATDYQAVLTFKETDYYIPDATHGTKTVTFKIAQAPLTIATLPTVTVNNAGNYEITGGVVKFGEKVIAGSFKTVQTSDFSTVATEPAAGDKGKSHIIGVLFTPSNDLDKANFIKPMATVNVIVPNSDLQTYKVTMKESIPTNFSIQWTNGGKPVNISTDVFAADTKLTATVTYPKGTKDVALKLTSNQSTSSVDLVLASSADGKNVYTVTIKEASDLKIEAGSGYAYKVDLKTLKVDYTGEPLEYAKESGSVPVIKNLTITDRSDADVTSTKVADAKLTYKDASGKVVAKPIDAGSYTVHVTIAADPTAGYVEYSQDFPGALEVKKILPTVYKWPTASVIAKGQALSQSDLTEGAASIPGAFKWSDETIKHDVAGTYRHEVTFFPSSAYSKNYLEVVTSGGEDLNQTIPDNQWVIMKVSELQIVTYAPKEGTIVVTNQLGQQLPTGAPVTKGDILTISVTPREGFELKTLTVNGTAYSSTYTVGTSSVAIEATFDVKTPVVPDPEPGDPVIDPNSQYAVTLPKKSEVRGVVISHPGVNAVTKDKPFSFTLNTLAADADKVVVKANGVELKPTSGVYKIDKVSANTAITVTLAAPTKLNVTVETVSKNAKGYVMGTVQVAGSTDGVCYFNDEITLVAFPESGVSFTGWSDDATVKTQLRKLTVTKDVAIKALYSGIPTGMESIATAQIFGSEGCLVIRGIGEAKLTVVGMDGRIQKHQLSGDSRIQLQAGVYGIILEDGAETIRTKVIVK